MPKVPKWVGDAIENLLASKFLSVTVSSTQYLSPSVKKISFTGDFTQTDFYPSQAVSLRVSDTEHRNYTPCSFDPENGVLEIIFHLHGAGPGSRFADDLKPGVNLKMIPPRGHKMLDRDKKNHFFFGDETTLSLYYNFADQINRTHQQYMGILELDPENFILIDQLGLKVKAVLKSPENPAQNSIACLDDLQHNHPDAFESGVFYLTGNAASVQQFRKALKMRGVISKQIKTQAYWAAGKAGL
ncbi:siderophore-interacting protein [Pedobacter metabolipauper]|uniref:NADPH-dependent ferric siderophore reductase n=1 Tax=Pedobacter metabolipauper TaxID=425513 RepID=A0A4R6SZA4_9SPHI|nr:siderophore-interacting protein [Pedobacter metabolipauper]TDQ11786.1 NADPH-dependent ferric siderophore reductase [Pedobacter metabolipauper]